MKKIVIASLMLVCSSSFAGKFERLPDNYYDLSMDEQTKVLIERHERQVIALFGCSMKVYNRGCPPKQED